MTREGRRQRSGPIIWALVIVVGYLLISAAIAVATADKCGGNFRGDKEWVMFPPGWECQSRLPGFQ